MLQQKIPVFAPGMRNMAVFVSRADVAPGETAPGVLYLMILPAATAPGKRSLLVPKALYYNVL